MSANCQFICFLLTETTCSTLSLDLSALKDTCSSLSSRHEFICKLKKLNLPRFVLPYRDWAKYDYCTPWTRISFNSRKHGFGDCILPKPCTLFHTFYILPFLSVPCIPLKKSYSHRFYCCPWSLPWRLHQPCMCGASDLELDCRVSSVLTLTLEHRISLCFETSWEGELVISPWCDKPTVLI